MLKRSILVLLALIHGLTGILFAQEKYNYEVGPYISVGAWQDRHFQIGPPQASPAISGSLHLAERPIYGVRVNFLSRRHWGGELAYSYELNTTTITRQGFKDANLQGGVHHFLYNEVFYPVRYEKSAVLPFFTAGIGVAGYHIDEESRARVRDPKFGLGEVFSSDRFAFNYGGGIKANITHSFGIRADFRHNFSDVPTFGVPNRSFNPAQPVLPIGGKLQMYEGSFGIYYHVAK